VVTPSRRAARHAGRWQFQTAPDNGSGAPGSWSILSQSDAIAVASLVQGYKFLPGELPGGTQRFIRLNYAIGTAVMTAGTLKAALVPSLDVQPVVPARLRGLTHCRGRFAPAPVSFSHSRNACRQ